MAKYLLVESRDPFETQRRPPLLRSGRVAGARREPRDALPHAGGVLAARAGQHTFWFAALIRVGVEVLADARSLRERGIAGTRCRPA